MTISDASRAELPQVAAAAAEPVAASQTRWLARIAAWAIAAAVIAVVVWRVDLSTLVAALQQASWRWLGLAVVCGAIAGTLSRVRRWQALLEPIPHRQRATFVDLVRILFASGAISNLLPARAGEAVRVVELVRRRGYPAGALIAAQLAEKGIEAISLGLVFGAFAVFPGPRRMPLAIAGGLAVAAVVVLAALPRRAPGAAGRFLQALRAVHAERSWVSSLAWSVLSDVVDVLVVALCLHAVAIDVDPSVWGVVLLSINVALLLPSTPAQIGILEGGAVLGLTTSGVAAAPALAFALVYHAIHLIPGTVLGALAIWLPWE